MPAIEARFTIQPREALSSGIASRVTSRRPRRLTPSWRSMCFACRVSAVPAMPMPAEFTSTSSPPKRSLCSRTTRIASSSLPTFAVTACAPSSAAAASTFACVREASVRSKPSSRSMRAIARPMPDEPPVTSALGIRCMNLEESGCRAANAPAARPFPLPRMTAAPGRRLRLDVRSFVDAATAELTDLATAGGCAAKYSPARLEELLRGFVPAEAADLLVGLDPADDAAVYRLDDERALVFTIDFFPPIVDDPGDFGAIAATNALNDVFAMGGLPLLALSVAALPEELPVETVRAIFDGAERQVRAAGAVLAGGHTIRDAEPKYGLAVVGTVHPGAVWRKSTARPGDALYLTKPLGTALVLGGAKRGLADPAEAVTTMRTLNRDGGRRCCGGSSRTR